MYYAGKSNTFSELFGFGFLLLVFVSKSLSSEQTPSRERKISELKFQLDMLEGFHKVTSKLIFSFVFSVNYFPLFGTCCILRSKLREDGE